MLQGGLPWGGVGTHTGPIPGSQSLLLEGKKVKGERPKAKEGVCQADEPGKPRVP